MTTPALTTIDQLGRHVGESVTLRGWVYGRRSGGKIVFLLLRDGTGQCQCVVEARDAQAFEQASRAGQESSIQLTGTVAAEERAPGGFEITVTDVRVLQAVEDYPIARKAHGVDFLLSHRHLWIRSQRQARLMKIRHTLVSAARAYFDDHGFTLVDTPLLTPGAAEGAGTLFPVDYFGETVYLAQTGQLYLESACMALGKVYCFGPTFRAEKSKTRRHLIEFWMIEPEIAFADLDTLLGHAEGLVSAMVAEALEKHAGDLRELGRDLAPLEAVTPPFPRITYSEAVDQLRSHRTRRTLEMELEEDRARLQRLTREIAEVEEQAKVARKKWQQEKLGKQLLELKEAALDLDRDLETRPAHLASAQAFEWGKDLGGDEETILSRQFQKPVFVTEYPGAAKAFYMKPSGDDPRLVLNFDLLAPEGYGEIIGGSVREEDLETLERRMAAEGMDPVPYGWYLDLRRYGTVPHGGFGLGIERTMAWICGLKHVRETIAFPRLLGRMYP